MYPVFVNIVDPDKLALEKPADQDQQCFCILIVNKCL